MSNYLEPIKIAIISFPFIAALFTLPFLIFQYKKHGYINKTRILVIYSFLLFLISAYYLVVLPLPKAGTSPAFKKPTIEYMQLIPFTFVLDFLKETNFQLTSPITYLGILKERAFLQVVLNIALIMPLGVYCKYYFNKTFKQAFIISILVSLFFEITQLTGLYGIYRVPYRLFDIDDLMLNTLGSVIGYLLAPKLTFFLPASNKLDINVDLKNIQVGFTRRSIAAGIDIVINSIICLACSSLILSAITMISYYIVLPYITNGVTLGKWIVRIRLKGTCEKITLLELTKRNIPLIIMLALQIALPFIWMISYNLCILMYMMYKTIRRDKILFYEKISTTKNVIICKETNEELVRLSTLNKVALNR